MSSKVCISGESPPWTHRNCWFMSAARGRQSNASIHESYTCSEYLILPDRRQTCNQWNEEVLVWLNKYVYNKNEYDTLICNNWQPLYWGRLLVHEACLNLFITTLTSLAFIGHFVPLHTSVDISASQYTARCLWHNVNSVISPFVVDHFYFWACEMEILAYCLFNCYCYYDNYCSYEWNNTKLQK